MSSFSSAQPAAFHDKNSVVSTTRQLILCNTLNTGLVVNTADLCLQLFQLCVQRPIDATNMLALSSYTPKLQLALLCAQIFNLIISRASRAAWQDEFKSENTPMLRLKSGSNMSSFLGQFCHFSMQHGLETDFDVLI